MSESLTLALVATLALALCLPALSSLYREYLDAGSPRSSAIGTIAISGTAAAVWLAIGAAIPEVSASALYFPTAAMSGLGAFLTTVVVRDQFLPLIPALIFSFAWTTGVFTPIAIAVFFPATVGLNPAAAPADLGGVLLTHITAGSSVLAIMVLERRRPFIDRAHARPAPARLTASAIALWGGWAVAMVSLELAIDTVTPLIIANCVVGPLMAMAGFLVIQRIMMHRSTAQGAVAGLVCGIVAITPGCAYLDPLFGATTGALAGVVGGLFAISRARATGRAGWFLVSAHLFGAVIGIVMLGPFIIDVGLVYTGQAESIVNQLAAAVLATLWATGVSFALWPLTRRLELLWGPRRQAIDSTPPIANSTDVTT